MLQNVVVMAVMVVILAVLLQILQMYLEHNKEGDYAGREFQDKAGLL